jgi:hypothetical protein
MLKYGLYRKRVKNSSKKWITRTVFARHQSLQVKQILELKLSRRAETKKSEPEKIVHLLFHPPRFHEQVEHSRFKHELSPCLLIGSQSDQEDAIREQESGIGFWATHSQEED